MSGFTYPPLTSRGATSIAISAALLGLCLVTYILRVYAARERKKQTGWRWDLIWVTITIVFGLVGFAAQIATTRSGLGHHLDELSLPQILDTIYWAFISIQIYIVAGAFAKLSIVALLLTIQGIDAKKRRMVLYFLGTFQALVNLVLVLLLAFECAPIRKLWVPFIAGECKYTVAGHRLSYFQGCVSALTDWALGLWPLTMINQLRISKKSKVSFCALLGVGCIPGIASILRTVVTYRAVASPDETYEYPLVITWTTVEIWLILILGSAPSLRPLFSRVFGLNKTASSQARTTSAMPTTNTRKINSQLVASRIDGIDIEALDDLDAGDEHKEEKKDEDKMNTVITCSTVIVQESNK